MSALIVDTNAYSALLRGNPDVEKAFEDTDRLIFPFIVVAELLSGFRAGTREKFNREGLLSLLNSAGTEVLYPSMLTMDTYATIYADLRRKGKPIPTNDLWIAALAVQHNIPLFTFDGHFSAIEGIILSKII